MNSTAGILARIPLFKLYRKFGWPQLLPLNLTLSPSPKCNSRCLTCNIWMKRENELTIEEWDKVLASLGQAPYWFTISGGEPLMYPHVVELAQLAYKHCSPGVINIPTNAILPNIPERVERIAKSCPNSQLIINLSLDGVGAKHDHIRGIPGNFAKFEQRLKQLLSLRKTLKNLTVGIDSVESKRFTGVAKITEALRVEYYKLVKRILDEKDQVIDCYAGWVSAQIYADGTVWPCCVRADNLGNLRDHHYDFKEIWFGDKIKEVRRSIAAKECHCPLANASYTNMLHNIPTLARVGAKVLSPSTHS